MKLTLIKKLLRKIKIKTMTKKKKKKKKNRKFIKVINIIN